MDKNLITTFFSEDHDRLDGVFVRFQNCKDSDPAAAATLLAAFTSGLLRHIDWEEQILFPLFEARTGSSMGPTQVMRFEHGQIKSLLESIGQKLGPEQDTRTDEQMLLRVLGEHNMKEEQILYPAIDNQLTAPEVVGVFDRIKVSL